MVDVRCARCVLLLERRPMSYITSPLGLLVVQGIIAVGVAWAIQKLSQVHALVNSRSKAQDEKIAVLEAKIDSMRTAKGVQDVTLATERALSVPPAESHG